MKKLYKMTAEYYVMAEDPLEALHIRPEIDTCTVSACIAETVMLNWASAIPFGTDDDRTCAEIIAAKG